MLHADQVNLRLLGSVLGGFEVGFGMGWLVCVRARVRARRLYTQCGWSCLFLQFIFTLEPDSRCALQASMLRMECARLSDVLHSRVYPGPQPKHDYEQSQDRQEKRWRGG